MNDTDARDDDITAWSAIPRDVLEAMDPEGDFAKKHLANPTIFRMLGDLHGRRVLDAGCGQGYLSRLMAERGAAVVGVEPAAALYDYCIEAEHRLHQGVRYVRADLTGLRAEPAFDAVVCSMVLQSIRNWRAAMRACVDALRPGGLFVFAVVHPCFEDAAEQWRRHGQVCIREYLPEYALPREHAPDYHRPMSAYFNAVVELGCVVREVAEPGLAADVAEAGPPGSAAYAHVPNFLIVAASRQ